ncbi:ATP-binding protein [Streptomyces sp. NPDC059894]|uniref:ATP-binding protein n=1 Tax=unclassified Streptomyces TaxID=2593676 RepID=UPI0036474D76
MSDVNQQTAPSAPAPARQFSVSLSATRRGARLARLFAAQQLLDWGLPLDPARLVVAELAANAALHGRVPGRSFRLTLSVTASGTLRVEVGDSRGDQVPSRAPAAAGVPAESGYGLLLVEELADRWGVRPGPVPYKTVWAEIDLASPR